MLKIFLEKNQSLFFTSDTHYNHSAICRGTSPWPEDRVRDFDTLDKMNQALVDNINAKVGPDDILLHHGDWSFGGFDSIAQFRERITCQNIILILGNHDHHIERNKGGIRKLFKEVVHYALLDIRRDHPDPKSPKKIQKLNMVCCHFPIASWDNMNRGVIHTHGHVHLPPQHKIGNGRSIDVGVDGNNLDPYSLDEILKLMKNQPIKSLSLPIDHHAED